MRRLFLVADSEDEVDAAPAGDVHRATAVIVRTEAGWRIHDPHKRPRLGDVQVIFRDLITAFRAVL